MRAGRAALAAAAIALGACASGVETNGGGGATTTTTSSTTSSSTSTTSTSSTSSTSTSSSTTSSTSSTTSSTTGTGGGGAGGTGGTGTGGATCQWSKVDPCGAGLYCDAPGCGSGTCKPVPTTESPNRAPVCGCDGVTYWNATIAASHGTALQTNGVCSPAKTCGGIAGSQCPAGASCNYHLADESECNLSDQLGTCWAVPQACPQIVVGVTQHACQSVSCTDECNLIKLMTPWYDDPTCPQ